MSGDVEAARKALDRGADTECLANVRLKPCRAGLLLRRSALTRATAVGAACGRAQDDGGTYETPLQHAASNGHASVVTLLLDKGANIEAQNGVRRASAS